MEDSSALQPRWGRDPGKRKIHNAWHAFLGAAATMCGTTVAIFLIPDDPQSSGALFWPAVSCSLGLVTVPLLALRQGTETILRTENVLMIGLIYWLLFELLQGSYPLDTSYDNIVLSFIAIGLMAAGIWIGVAGAGKSLPGLLVRAVTQQLHSKSLFRACLDSVFSWDFLFCVQQRF